MSTNFQKKSVYEIITERFTAQLSKGIIPWEKPWVSVRDKRCGGWSHTTGKPYSLINQMMLPSEGEYITYRQIQDEGGTLKKGAQGYPICFWKSFVTDVRNPRTNKDEQKSIPVLRYYTVYHVEDVDGISYNYSAEPSDFIRAKEPQRCKVAEVIKDNYLKRTGVKFTSRVSDEAYYSPISDEVVIPLKKQFETKSEYYSTMFHELVHSTGHRSRLNRVGTPTHHGKDYSLEELVAEIGACAITYELNIATKRSLDNSVNYILGWLRALQNDPTMIVKAAARAKKAVSYLLGDDGIPACNDVKKIDYSDAFSK